MQVDVPVIVQHHPARGHLLPALLERLAPLPVQVVSDPDPDSEWRSSWRTFRACLEAFPDDATHVLVVQDDMTPARDLAAALPHVIAGAKSFSRADPVIVLSFTRLAYDIKVDVCPPRFLELLPVLPLLPTPATVWPRYARDHVLSRAPEAYVPPPGSKSRVYRTKRVYYFTDERGVELGEVNINDSLVVGPLLYPYPAVALVPNLLGHQDREPTILWTDRPDLAVPGERQTSFYIGDDRSALEVLSTLAQQEVAV